MQELSCLRAKLWFLVDDNEHAMWVPLSNFLSLCWATNVAFIQPALKKKKGHKKVFQRTNTVWGVWGC